MRGKRTTEEMHAHLKSWQQSGLSRKAYCLENNIPYFTFQYWRDKLIFGKSKKRFIQFKVKSPDDTLLSSKIEFHVPGKGHFVFPESCPAAHIKSILGL